MKFAIYDAAGYDKNNWTRRYSAHKTLKAAMRTARRQHVDENGIASVCIAESKNESEFSRGIGGNYSDALCNSRDYIWHSIGE